MRDFTQPGTEGQSSLEESMPNQSLIGEFWEFLKVRKKWWLTPIVLFLVLLGALIVMTQGSALAPFIYTLF